MILTLKGSKVAYINLLATRAKVVFKNICAFYLCFVMDTQPEDWHGTKGNQLKMHNDTINTYKIAR